MTSGTSAYIAEPKFFKIHHHSLDFKNLFIMLPKAKN